MTYARPTTVNDALTLLASDAWQVLSGGTDFYPALRDAPVTGNVLDISKLTDLESIRLQGDYWHIGARATWTDILRAELPPAFDSLALAAREVGSVQIQNRATVIGNLCNASPAADGVPPLLCLDAEVCLASRAGARIIPLHSFIKGNRHTLLRPDELVTGIRIPASASRGVSHFLKLGARKYLIISIAMVAIRVAVDETHCINDIAISVGSCSVVAQRLTSLEQTLLGKRLDAQASDLVNLETLDTLTPIDDIRATSIYRQQAACQLIRRCLISLSNS